MSRKTEAFKTFEGRPIMNDVKHFYALVQTDYVPFVNKVKITSTKVVIKSAFSYGQDF